MSDKPNYDFAIADLLADDPEIKALRETLDEVRVSELAKWAAEKSKQGYYLRDERTGEKIYMKAQQIEDCQAQQLGYADNWCAVCREPVEAVVCMWKSEFGNPADVDSWAHYCAEHAREAGLPV